MTREEIINFAREAGLEDWAVYGRIESKEECLKRFATFVAAAEREACARVAENLYCGIQIKYEMPKIQDLCAAAIRARGAYEAETL